MTLAATLPLALLWLLGTVIAAGSVADRPDLSESQRAFRVFGWPLVAVIILVLMGLRAEDE